MIGIPNLLMIHARLLAGYLSGKLIVKMRYYFSSRNICLLPFLVWAGPVLSSNYVVYMVDENHFKIEVDVNDPLFYGEWQWYHAGNDHLSVKPKFYGIDNWTPILIPRDKECRQDVRYPLDAFINVEHEDHRIAIRSVLEKLNSCIFTNTEYRPGTPAWAKLRLYVGVTVGSYFANMDLVGGSLEPEPNQCSASIDAMDFGLINPNSMPIKKADLLVSCSRDADISISTNHGRRFVDVASGTEIEFIDPPAFALSSCTKYCIVNIEGRMTKTPNNKGSYKWFVPVVIEYL
ncbi:hypothetical protein ACYVOU_000516 [Vibrio cholerae]